MTDLFARVDPGWLIFVGVFLGALLLIEGLRQLTARRETDAEARSRRMRLIAGGTQIEERLDILLPGENARTRFLGLDLGNMLTAAGLPAQPMLFGLGALALFCLTALGLMPTPAGGFTQVFVDPVIGIATLRQAGCHDCIVSHALDVPAAGLMGHGVIPVH
ncbi:MAG: hypothetical protein V4516_12075, partial [Pseudomonadota bacterium]